MTSDLITPFISTFTFVWAGCSSPALPDPAVNAADCWGVLKLSKQFVARGELIYGIGLAHSDRKTAIVCLSYLLRRAKCPLWGGLLFVWSWAHRSCQHAQKSFLWWSMVEILRGWSFFWNHDRKTRGRRCDLSSLQISTLWVTADLWHFIFLCAPEHEGYDTRSPASVLSN